MPSPSSLRIATLHTGSELLQGLQTNQHLALIGHVLAIYGAKISESRVVPDSLVAIKRALKALWRASDVLIVTGGLGPTSDDLTREAVAEALTLPLQYDAKIEKMIFARLAKSGRVLSDLGRKQCLRPLGFQVIENLLGTAPGLYFHNEGKYLFLLPGPTQELKPMLEETIVDILKAANLLSDQPAFIQFRTESIPEVDLAELLTPLFDKHPGLEVAYCAHADQIDVRLSPGTSGLSWKEIHAVAAECENRIGEDFLTHGFKTLPEVVLELLRDRSMSLSTAESCTGGLLSSAFTSISGASKAFAGGLICYSNDAKVELLQIPESLILQHGAVSAEVAVAMAAGVAELFGTEYALSTTGFAGPEGGTSSEPVGTVYLGYYGPEGAWSRRLVFPSGRVEINQRTVNAALDWLRRELLLS